MRFSILRPRTDAVTAEQVREARDAFGWTVEQLADAVAASPLEVSAWEAGTVPAPPLQAAWMQWLLAWNRRTAAVGALGRIVPCRWVREHRPGLYERMATEVAGDWYALSREVRDHFARCPRCKAVWDVTSRMRPLPPPPDEARFDTWSARYYRWVERLPGWAQGPFTLLGLLPGLALIGSLILTVPDPDAGLAAHIAGLGFGAGAGWGVFQIFLSLLSPVSERWPGARAVLAGITGSLAGLLGWSVFDSAIVAGDPRALAGAAALGTVLGLMHARRERNEAAHEAQALAAAEAHPSLTAPQPDSFAGVQSGDLEAVRTVVEAGRYEH